MAKYPSLKEVLLRQGFTGTVVQDGRIHRFSVHGDNGMPFWYVFYPSGVGIVGNWRTGERTVCSDMDFHSLSLDEQRRFRAEAERASREAEEAQSRLHKAKADEAVAYCSSLLPASDNNPYLMRKHVHSVSGLLGDGNRLVMPISSPRGIRSYQTIYPDGTKRLMKGGEVNGNCFIIGNISKRMFLVEGLATGLSVHEATGRSVVVAVFAGNLKAVSDRFRRTELTAVADNDESKTGERKARETGRKVILIPDNGMDANDYANAYGLDALRKLLREAI